MRNEEDWTGRWTRMAGTLRKGEIGWMIVMDDDGR